MIYRTPKRELPSYNPQSVSPGSLVAEDFNIDPYADGSWRYMPEHPDFAPARRGRPPGSKNTKKSRRRLTVPARTATPPKAFILGADHYNLNPNLYHKRIKYKGSYFTIRFLYPRATKHQVSLASWPYCDGEMYTLSVQALKGCLTRNGIDWRP